MEAFEGGVGEGVHPPALRQWVREYLIEQCYTETLQSMDASGPGRAVDEGIPDRDDTARVVQSMRQRKQLVNVVEQGDMSKAREQVEAAVNKYGALQSNPLWLDRVQRLRLRMICAEFLELVDKGQRLEALELAQAELADYDMLSLEFAPILQDHMVLLAYSQPRLCPVGDLLKDKRREEIARDVNSLMFNLERCGGMTTGSPYSRLELVARQIVAVCSTIEKDQTSSDGTLLGNTDPLGEIVDLLPSTRPAVASEPI